MAGYLSQPLFDKIAGFHRNVRSFGCELAVVVASFYDVGHVLFLSIPHVKSTLNQVSVFHHFLRSDPYLLKNPEHPEHPPLIPLTQNKKCVPGCA